MKKWLWLAWALVTEILVGASSAQTAAYHGVCTQGATAASVQGLLSTNKQVSAFPSCTVRVYLTGTSTLTTIYSDSNNTPLANPFIAPISGLFSFYAAIANHYDVTVSGTGMTTTTTTDVVAQIGGSNFSSLVQLSPSGTQTIVQPSGTSFNVSSLNYVIDATQQPNADLGDRVTAAANACALTYKALPGTLNNDGTPGYGFTGCKITIESQPGVLYSFTHTMVINMPPQAMVDIDFGGALLQFTAAGNPISLLGNNLFKIHVHNLHLAGNPSANGGMFIDSGASFTIDHSDFSYFSAAGACAVILGGTDTSIIENNSFHNNYKSLCSAISTGTGYGPNAMTVRQNHFYGDTYLPADMDPTGSLDFYDNTFDPPAYSAIGFAHFGDGGYHVHDNYFEGIIGPTGTQGYAMIFTGHPLTAQVDHNHFFLTYNGGTFAGPVLVDSSDSGGCFASYGFENNDSGGGDPIFIGETVDCGTHIFLENNGVGNGTLGPTFVGRTGNGHGISTYSATTTPMNFYPASFYNASNPNPGQVTQMYINPDGNGIGWHINNIIEPLFRCNINDYTGNIASFGYASGGFGYTVGSYISCADSSFHGPVVGTAPTAAAGSNSGAIANTQYADRAIANLRTVLAGGTPTATAVQGSAGAITGSDANFTYTFTLSAASTAGSLANFTYGVPSTNTPHCVFGSGDTGVAGRILYTTVDATTGFTLGISTGIAAGTYIVKAVCPRF